MMRRQANFSRQTTLSHCVTLGVWSLLGILMIGVNVARADCPPEPPPPSSGVSESGKAAAQALFKAGIEFRDKQEWAQALLFFLQSRAIERRVSSTWNAAHCLNQLKRYPEALAFYEEVQRDFGAGLTAEKKAEIEEAIRDLQSKILIAEIKERSGHYAVSDVNCGELPRKQPVYLLPGEHRLRIWQADKPPSVLIFRGNPGERMSVRLPPAILPKGQWFVQGAAGVGYGGSKSSQFVGTLAQTRDGYRFPNRLSLALVMGIFYSSLTAESEDPKYLPSGENDIRGVVKPYFVRQAPVFGPFMGFSAGWEPRVDNHFNALFRLGVGIMGAQSKSEIDIVRGTDRHSVDDENVGGKNVVSVRGREVIRTNPPYATFDVGLMFRRDSFYIGASLGVFFTWANWPVLPEVLVSLRENDRINTVTFDAPPEQQKDSIDWGLLVLPQIVVGFDP